MRTPREILFERHQGVETKLDAVRRQALAALDSPPPPEPLGQQRRRAGGRALREIIFSLRWHLAGLGAAWMLILVLSFDDAPNPAEGIARAKIPPPRELLAALLEHRRELLELTASSDASEPGTLPVRRSEVESRIAIG
jgi:hypothetical protein